ncbi:MAG: sulfotransferase [Deltaproteobacteria bacterium]|nr:sulfotransferase [Deltaproteobacteria bacterium]
MNLPNFFIAGSPRSGTTALFHYLKQHPEIYMCPDKEPYFFCTDFHEESDKFFKRNIRFPIRTKEDYLKLFKNAGNEKIVGEATPEYLFSKTAARNIFNFNKDSRILISLRNPVDYLYSLHAQLLYFNAENIADFQKAFYLEPERRKGYHMPKGLLWPSSLYYSERIKYSEQVSRYLDIFPKDQIKIVIFEDFKADNLSAYRDILGFLDVADDFKPLFNVYNPGGIPRLASINQLLIFLGNMPIKNIIPPSLRKRVNITIRRLNKKPAKRLPLNPGFREQMLKEFRPHIEELSRLLERDLVNLWR